MVRFKQTRPNPLWYWFALGFGVLALSSFLSWLSHSFSEEVASVDLPVSLFLIVLIAGTAATVLSSIKLLSAPQPPARLLFLIFVIGLSARFVHFGAVPILEDDYQRYLWDGALLAKGLSPYLYAPLSFLNAEVDAPAYWDLAETAWPVIERINHPEYRTVYPPMAQIAFAASYWIAPLSLEGWRVVLLFAEIGVFAILVGILRTLGRNPIWAVLYWWHPLVIKEVANSAHLEPVLMLFVLGALWAAMTGHVRFAALFLALGFGVKVWPLLLMAPLLWSLRRMPMLALQSALIFGVSAALMLWPVLSAGLSESSGFVAFARGWAASSAAILVSDTLANGIGAIIGVQAPELLSRVLLGLLLSGAIIVACLRQSTGPKGMAYSFFVITAALFLLSPSVTPWYVLWLLPFLCLFPNPALHAASVLMGLHYSYFPLVRIEAGDFYRYGVVWLIWVPVWIALAWGSFRKGVSYA
jgi:alpha-1,6-mannosyltransferase